MPASVWALIALMVLSIAPALGKEGVSLLTPEEAQALKASMNGKVDVPADLAAASDAELWDFVPPATLHRAVFLGSFEAGCPVHGKELFRVGGGFYPWKYSREKPYQVTCPVGGETYPSNDFGAFLKGGMKDKALLTGDTPDDGTGWVDAKGNRYFFVGYWVFHQRWYDVLKGITSFTNAYFATGDERYAHKATVIFCALAEQYQHMDFPKQGGNGDGGMILPWCWENQTVVTPMSEAYDRLFPYLKQDGDAALREFIKTKTDLGPRKQIEQRFMQTIAKTEFSTDMYWSNECDHQLAFADWALAWDNNDPADGITTKQAVDWIINHGGDNSLEELLYNCTYRDGFPCEGAIGYSHAVAGRILAIAERLKRCGIDLYKDFPRLRYIAGCWLDMTLEGDHCPSLGDSGSVIGGGPPRDDTMLHLAWENLHDPKFAQALWGYKSFRRAPYTPDREAELAQVVKEHGERPNHETRNLGGMGLALLESGGPLHPRGVAMYYGSPAGGHAHHDRLNIEFFDHGQSVMPDLGYPDQWGAKAQHFTQNSIAHYAVLVDEQGEKSYMAGYLDLLHSSEGVQLASAHAERGFPGTSLYRRECAMIDLSPERCYLVDLFRVRGGKQHDYSYHLPPVPAWGIEGTTLGAPAKGTLAGEGIAEGQDLPEGQPKNGFNWFTAPQRGPAQNGFTFLGKANAPYPQVRFTMLPGCADEVIVGDHETPRIGVSLPPQMKWLLARHNNVGAQGSVFAGVVEACPDAPAIKALKRLPVTGGTEPVAMQATTDGFSDTIISDETGAKPVTIGGESFQGRFGFVRQDARGVSRAVLVGGSKLSLGKVAIQTVPYWEGALSAPNLKTNELGVNVALPPGDALKGQWMIISNGRHETAYEIASVKAWDKGSLVQLTDVSPMVGKGYVTSVQADKRLIHTDSRWRTFGRDEIWQKDFGPALGGYMLFNEDLTGGVEIEDCKLMPSRERKWWKPEPGWIKARGWPSVANVFKDDKGRDIFTDKDGDGKIGFWVYDFCPWFGFRVTNQIALERVTPRTWAVKHCGATATVTLPCVTPLKTVLVGAAGKPAQAVAATYNAAAKTVTFALPAGLPQNVTVCLREAKGVNLSAVTPPAVKGIMVDGTAAEANALGNLVVTAPPQRIEISFEDAANALDPQSVFAQAGTKTVYAGEAGLQMALDKTNPKRGVLSLAPPQIVAFADSPAPQRYGLRVGLAGLSGTVALDFTFVLSPRIPEGSVYLSDLEPVKAYAHAGLIRDRAYLGGTVQMDGVPYPKALMVCPETTAGPVNYGEVVYKVPGQFRQFRAVIGIDAAAGGGSVIFSVQLRKGGGEWQPAFKSGVVMKNTAPQAVTVPLGDAEEIRLYTDANGDIGCDHAVFGAARFEP